jgi:Leucine-rich repeat (LRR) protein
MMMITMMMMITTTTTTTMMIMIYNDDDDDDDDNDDDDDDDNDDALFFSAKNMGTKTQPGGILFLLIVVVVLVESIDLPSYRTILRSNPYDDGARSINSFDRDPWRFCFEDKCRCRGHVALCANMSELCGKIQYHEKLNGIWGLQRIQFRDPCYLPSLPTEISALDLSGSYAKSGVILTRDFFVNVTQITYLDFSRNTVLAIRGNPFEALTNLITLLWNQVQIKTGWFSLPLLSPLSFLENLELTMDYDVDTKFNMYVQLEENVDQYLPRLRRLLLDGYPLGAMMVHVVESNQIYSTDGCSLSLFSNLRNLTELSLAGTEIAATTMDAPLSVEVLNLEDNVMDQFPETCYNTTSSLFPELLSLDLSNNAIEHTNTMICLPKLQFLNISGNRMYLQGNTFSPHKFPSLQMLVFQGQLSSRQHMGSFNNSAIQYLVVVIRSNREFFASSNTNQIPGSIFEGCGNLKMLHINYNDRKAIPLIQNDIFMEMPNIEQLRVENCDLVTIDNQIFRWTQSLGKVELSSNSITSISDGAFATLSNLSELDLRDNKMAVIRKNTFVGLTQLKVLHLAGNKISVISDGAFSYLTHLITLNLTGNEVSIVPQGTFSPECRGRLEHVDLSNNKLACNCSMQWFRAWFVRRREVFAGDDHQYNCSNLLHTNMQTWHINSQACLFTDPRYFIITFVWSMLLLVALLTTLVCLQRGLKTRARRLLRRFIRMQRMRQALNVNDGNYQYDVFVSYAEEDGDWVRNVLVPEMEGRWGYRLCLHYRDFHPGKQILDNIKDSVDKSRWMMFVFSLHFARSRWCQFELSLGLGHAMNHDIELLVLYLSEVPPEEMTAGMVAILRSHTYLQWAERGWEAAQFWHNLRAALPNVVTNEGAVNQPVLPAVNDANDGHYEYDLFVSYAEEDRAWVQNVLAPKVEGHWGVKLCLHHRDFHPGKQVLENIECCVEGSRRMMFVFSPHFARSPWCQFELSLGLDHAMNRDDDILVVNLCDVDPEELTATMAAILRSCTYLQWAERGPDVAQFWNNLRAALPNPGRRQQPHADRLNHVDH